MSKNKKIMRPFTINASTEKAQLGARVFSLVKQESALSVKGIAEKADMPSEQVADLITSGVKRDLLKIGGGSSGELVKFNGKYGKMLGIGFEGTKCFMTVVDAAGETLDKEKTEVGIISSWKGRNKEIAALLEAITERTKIKSGDILCAGIAVPEEMEAANPKSAELLAEGIQGLFGCDVFTCKGATAAAYGEKNAVKGAGEKDILYLHSDVGTGVVIKKEMIFEAGPATGEKAYLKPWDQFGIVHTAKDMVNKGIGTDIVNMANGDVDMITLDVVLKAADKNDELAGDLVKRAGLALGVRAAYLVNIFQAFFVILGGGIEGKEGGFIEHVKESSKRFLIKDIKSKVEIVPGVLGKEASSIGAAALCRRELFMEV